MHRILVVRVGRIEHTAPAADGAAPEELDPERLDPRGREGLSKTTVNAFAEAWFGEASQDRIQALLMPSRQRFGTLADEEEADFRKALLDYTRLFSFLSQLLSFTDAGLQKTYHFARLLRRILPAPGKEELPIEIRDQIDLESLAVRKRSEGKVRIERGGGELEPRDDRSVREGTRPDEFEPLSVIIERLNEQFGLDLGPDEVSSVEILEDSLKRNPALGNSLRVNPHSMHFVRAPKRIARKIRSAPVSLTSAVKTLFIRL